MAKKPTPAPTTTPAPVAATPLREEWPALNVERRAIKSLKPYMRNARDHNPQQVNQIVASIREWGWTMPILVDEAGEIIAGHGRLLAAEKLGMTEVPVVVARGWSDEQKRAYGVADNRLGDNSTWNAPRLRMEIANLKLTGFNLDLLAFSQPELKRLEMGFAPNLAPTSGGRLVTQADLDKAASSLGTQMSGSAGQDIIYVECPHCGEKYGISKGDLLK